MKLLFAAPASFFSAALVAQALLPAASDFPPRQLLMNFFRSSPWSAFFFASALHPFIFACCAFCAGDASFFTSSAAKTLLVPNAITSANKAIVDFIEDSPKGLSASVDYSRYLYVVVKQSLLLSIDEFAHAVDAA
jgi:hypothetical protein